MNKYYNNIDSILKKAAAYKSVLNLLDYDMQVNAPSDADNASAKIAAEIADAYRELFVQPRTGRLLNVISRINRYRPLSPYKKIMLREAVRERNKLLPVSASDYREFTELTSYAATLWSRCRENNDYDSFAPVLRQIIAYKRKFAECRREGSMTAYDVLLGDYEPAFTTDVLDDIIDEVKDALIPIIRKYTHNTGASNDSNAPGTLVLNDDDRDTLKEFCTYISSYIGFDTDRGVIGESAHPFTLGIHNRDVRMTNNYSGNNFIYPIFSALHETGHALYEQGIDDRFTLTIIGEGTSEGMHESISRFYENMVGRNEAFWKPLYPKLVSDFPDKLKDISVEEFLELINRVTPGAVRTSADELTYPMHIIIRYELEKELISGRLTVNNLPDEWNRLYREYLNVEPSSDSEGVLQDIHWSMGDFGYFPSYLIGSAAATQIYYHLCDVMPYDSYLETGNINIINDYLKMNIFRYGKSMDMNSLLKHMTGEEFNVLYYIEYLKGKYQGNRIGGVNLSTVWKE